MYAGVAYTHGPSNPAQLEAASAIIVCFPDRLMHMHVSCLVLFMNQEGS